MTITISPTGRVVCQTQLTIPLSASQAWGQLRHFSASAVHDPFHVEIKIGNDIPRAGASLLIHHRYLLYHLQRKGRILWWREGTGFAFSDLSIRRPERAFPHVLRYRLQPLSDQSCQLHIHVGGRWTAPVPRWIAKLWLRWVFSHVARNTKNQLLHFALALKRNAPSYNPANGGDVAMHPRT